MDRAAAEKVLKDAGFSAKASAFGFSTVFTSPRIGATNWVLRGEAQKKGEEFERIDLALHKRLDDTGLSYGTVHRFQSLDGLAIKLAEAIEHLIGLANDEQRLRCPECRVRFVFLMEPAAHNRIREPFLSCEGMQTVTRKRQGVRVTEILCRGTSRSIPALILY